MSETNIKTNGNGNGRISADSILKTVGGGLLTLCCLAIAWAAGNIINLKMDVTELKGKNETMVKTIESERIETIRRFTDLDRKFDKMETEVNKKLDKLDYKIEQLLRKAP